MLKDMYFEEYQERICNARSNLELAEFLTDYFLPVKYKGKELVGYYVDARGQIFSVRNNYDKPTKIKYNYNEGNCGYPKIRIDILGKSDFGTKYQTVTVHRLVCESFHEKPIPEGVTKTDWKKTPQSVKKCFDDYWEVNHIDHDRFNYHPSNLEWVSRQQNVNKYQKYLMGN